MKFGVWKALARGVVLESVRRKDLWVVAILGFLIMAGAGMLGFFGLKGLETFAKDLAASVLGMFSTVMAVLVGSRVMPEEIKNRTLYPLLARPITRFDLLFGKFIGATWVTWIAFLLLAGLTSLALAMFQVPFEAVMGQYLIAKMLGLSVIVAVSMTLSVFMTASAAATMSFVLAFGSSMIIRALVMAYESSSPAFQVVFKFLNAILPQYGLFDLGSRAANGWGPVQAWVLGALAAYALVYSSAMLSIGWLKFRKQAI
ncbi:MAG TPA: ABC transporter permease subunit [Fimbriimonadaceae bacterium]|nr:ABC transporter permease subunit [Fimbriimonadaceae bacterium]